MLPHKLISNNTMIRKSFSTLKLIKNIQNKNSVVNNCLSKRFLSKFKDSYDAAAAERLSLGIVPKPLDAVQTTEVVNLLKAPPKGEEVFLVDLISNRVPPGVDEAGMQIELCNMLIVSYILYL